MLNAYTNNCFICVLHLWDGNGAGLQLLWKTEHFNKTFERTYSICSYVTQQKLHR